MSRTEYLIRIKSVVCDKDKPDILLENVEVLAMVVGNTHDDMTKLCLTKSDGSYSFTLAPDKYHLVFRLLGDILLEDTVEVDGKLLFFKNP